MEKIFETLVDENLYKEWAPLLDWLFDDDKFVGWTSGYVGSLSKKIKRLEGIGKKNYIYEKYTNISFPKEHSRETMKVIMVKGSGESKDLIRHIRNGIAHGRYNLFRKEGKLYIELLDYSNNQTAYICIPLSYIKSIHILFIEIEKSRKNDRNKKKPSYKSAA